MQLLAGRDFPVIEEEKTEYDEEGDDFATFVNKNLTINMPKHIRTSFQKRKTELETNLGNRDNISALNICGSLIMDFDNGQTEVAPARLVKSHHRYRTNDITLPSAKNPSARRPVPASPSPRKEEKTTTSNSVIV